MVLLKDTVLDIVYLMFSYLHCIILYSADI